MNTDRKTAIIVGTLFIVATTASLVGTRFTGPLLNTPDYLAGIAPNGNQLLIGALLAFIAAASCAGIAISLYPVMRKYNEVLALGTVGFRLIESVFYIIGAVCLVSLVAVAHRFVNAGSPEAPILQISGNLLLTMRDAAGFIFAVLAFGVGALMYYSVFYRTRLIPRWLSVWGLLAIVALLAAVLITLLDGEPYTISGNLTLLALPIFLQEMVMAVWLIVKGFNPSASASGAVSITHQREFPDAVAKKGVA